jgi:hypothetical protein
VKKRGRPPTATPKEGTERSRKSRTAAKEKERKLRIVLRHAPAKWRAEQRRAALAKLAAADPTADEMWSRFARQELKKSNENDPKWWRRQRKCRAALAKAKLAAADPTADEMWSRFARQELKKSNESDPQQQKKRAERLLRACQKYARLRESDVLFEIWNMR